MKNFRFYLILAFVIALSLAAIPGCSPVSAPATAPATTPATPAVISPSVTPAAAVAVNSGTPDLVITQVWLDGLMVYYKIKNIGTADSPQTFSYIYLNDLMPVMGGTSFVDTLKPGEERTLAFTNYQWQFDKPINDNKARVLSEGYIQLPLSNNKVEVRADGENMVAELSENNNSRSTLVGMMYDSDLLRVSNLAIWKNKDGILAEPGTENTPAGAHFQIPNSDMEVTPELQVIPQQVPNGWMQGTFGYFYSLEEWNSPSIAAIEIPAKLHFVSRVGLSRNATGSDGVTFRFGLKDLNDSITWVASKTATTPGVFEDWNIDLSQYEGQKYFFLLRVDAGASPSYDFAIWNKARLMQIND